MHPPGVEVGLCIELPRLGAGVAAGCVASERGGSGRWLAVTASILSSKLDSNGPSEAVTASCTELLTMHLSAANGSRDVVSSALGRLGEAIGEQEREFCF